MQGQIFATVGTGGQSLFEHKNKPYFVASQYKGYGFLHVEFDGSGKLEAKFYGNNGIIGDEFVITK